MPSQVSAGRAIFLIAFAGAFFPSCEEAGLLLFLRLLLTLIRCTISRCRDVVSCRFVGDHYVGCSCLGRHRVFVFGAKRFSERCDLVK
jgi:hypothetical protein